MNAHPLVSVITVCLNNLEALKRTLESVREQTYGQIEYIIVDGGSTDGTLEYLHQEQGAYQKMVSEPDKGIYDAMNKGVKMASGEWVIFMNAGDRFAEADTLAHVFKANHDAEVIYGDVIKHGMVKKAAAPCNCHRMYFCHQSALTKRELLVKHPFDVAHRLSADFKFFKQMYLKGYRFVQLDLPIADFDTTGVSNTSRSKGLKDNIEVVKEVDNWKDKLRFLPQLYFVYFMCKLRNK